MEVKAKPARGGKRSRASGGTTVVLLEKKESEKERRKRMKALCEKLASLIPREHCCSSTVRQHDDSSMEVRLICCMERPIKLHEVITIHEEEAADDDNGRQFTTQHAVDTHVRGKALSVVYTNDPVSMESCIQTMQQFLAEDKYQVVGFDLEYTMDRPGHDQKVVVV
ncbi:hypothetical protein TRIUR3_16897 [Triticum urartu]|uniref:Uncharacterized protein n=1 Tax=Triticum urartu TaxID=4572 RepID=M7ZEF8_TRIUA|nr:hypothetical protein TRIUR3_16897 [Triticum urartu]